MPIKGRNTGAMTMAPTTTATLFMSRPPVAMSAAIDENTRKLRSLYCEPLSARVSISSRAATRA